MRVLIVGCGYVGLKLGQELLRAGHGVTGIRRSPAGATEMEAAGITPVITDITRCRAFERISGPFDWVVNTAAAGGGGSEDYRAVYLEGTRCLLEWLGANPPAKYVYTSSTGVYAQNDGSTVTEDCPTEPATETGRVLVETERTLLRAAAERDFPGVVLRVAGIYGPGRGYALKQYLGGEAVLAGDGSRLMNMIHRDDVARAIACALERGQPGRVYNVVDDEPVSQRDFYAWMAQRLGGPMPPSAGDLSSQNRRRGVTHKRVSNRRLREELGCELTYPTFRQGYAAEIRSLEASGKVPVRGCGK